jgi:hypothetical protein
MSLTAVKPYFKTHLSALGFREWLDAFNSENIPSTLLNGSFHLALPSSSAVPQNQHSLDISQSVTVTIARKGYRSSSAAVDQLLEDTQQILCRLLDPKYRVTGKLKNVLFDGSTVEALSQSNDNVALARLNFTCYIILNPGEE